MKQIINSFRQLDRSQVLIYVFSYLIYLTLNKFGSNSILYVLGEDSFRERWTNFSVPCGPNTTPINFVIIFQIFKTLLFFIMTATYRRRTASLISEFLIAYFFFDFIYVLSFIWEQIPIPFELFTWWILSSSGQVFLSRFIPYLDLVFAIIWTSLLFVFLYKRDRLSLAFVTTRLFIITLTIPIFYFIMYLILYRH
jgi:hypothetical protein